MKRVKIAALLLALLSAALAPAAAPAPAPAPAPKLRVAFSEAPPYSYHDAAGNRVGLYADLIRAFARAEGYDLEFVDGSWGDCLARTLAGETDLVMTITFTAAREELFDFVDEPVLTEWTQVIGRKGAMPAGPGDLAGKTVGFEAGDVSEPNFRFYAAANGIPGIMYAEYRTFDDMYAALERGEIDAGVAYSTIDLAGHPALAKSPIVVAAVQDGFAVAKGTRAALARALKERLVAWKADPSSVYFAAFRRYLAGASSLEATRTEVPPWVLPLVAALIGSALASTAAIRILTRRLRRRAAELKALNADLAARGEEMRRAEEAARESEARMKALGDNLPQGMVYQVDTGADGKARDMIFVGAGVEAIHQIGAAEALRDSSLIYRQFHPEDMPGLLAKEAEAIRTRRPFRHVARVIRPDGTLRWSLLVSSPRTQARGTLVWDGIEIDITDRMEAEERLREALEGKEALLRELFHRERNGLGVIVSMLRLQEGFAGDGAVSAALRKTEGRVHAMAIAHERLAEAGDPSVLDIGAYLHELLMLALGERPGAARRVRVEEALEPAMVSVDLAIPMGLAVHELLANALDHAFGAEGTGTLRLAARPLVDGAIGIEIDDDGRGFPEGFDPATGGSMGLNTAIALAEKQCGAVFRFLKGPGVRCSIIFRDGLYSKRV